MRCGYFDTHQCRSCTLMGVPYAVQLADKVAAARAELDDVAPAARWLPAVASRAAGFRNKAKLAVGGVAGEVTLGILDAAGSGVDLQGCGLYEPALAAALPRLAEFVNNAALQPYSVPQRRGELKFLLVTVSPDGQLMIRFVLRSTHHLAALRSRLSQVQELVPEALVVSVNVHPEHKATLEGEREIVLTADRALPLRLGDVTLSLPTRAFFQTNTEVAAELYHQAAAWTDAAAPRTLWDLYCGVGGFAAHLAAPGRSVLGVEMSDEAVDAARQATPEATFVAGDATAYALGANESPHLVVVNPPRRGLGPRLSGWLEGSAVHTMVYSSCNPASLAADLRRMPSWRVEEARVFDMFPQTRHAEVMVVAHRSG